MLIRITPVRFFEEPDKGTSGTPPDTKPQDGQQNQQQQNQHVPYDRFAQVVSERKAAQDELARLKQEQADAKKAADEKVAKDKGDYETLSAKLKADREAERAALTKQAIRIAKTMLGVKHGIAKDEYLTLFDTKFEVSPELEVTNFDAVDKAFETFKKDNPNLFGKSEPVPRTEHSKTKVSRSSNDRPLSPIELIQQGLDKERR